MIYEPTTESLVYQQKLLAAVKKLERWVDTEFVNPEVKDPFVEFCKKKNSIWDSKNYRYASDRAIVDEMIGEIHAKAVNLQPVHASNRAAMWEAKSQAANETHKEMLRSEDSWEKELRLMRGM